MEEVPCDVCALEAFGIAQTGEVYESRRVGGSVRECLALVREVEEIERREPWRRAARASPRHRDDLPGMAVRQRAKQHAVDNREHRGGGADAERQGYDSDGREAGLPPQHARAVSSVLPEATHDRSPF